jgi:hypothetical protein
MRERHVRDCDIARTKDLIVIGILTPSEHELKAQAAAASHHIGDRQRLLVALQSVGGGLHLSGK